MQYLQENTDVGIIEVTLFKDNFSYFNFVRQKTIFLYNAVVC